MELEHIAFRKTGYFSDLICDYLDENTQLQPFYTHFPSLEGFKKQIEEKRQSFSSKSRAALQSALNQQYTNIHTSEKTRENINLFAKDNTYTVVTGHQLNLFTGPLYFLYKIITTINLTEKLASEFPEYHFVPVYWMATEDHDFDEINYFHFHGEKIQWRENSKGPVGRLSTKSLDTVFETLNEKWGTSERADHLKKLFLKAYIEHETLTEATRYLVNTLFGSYGLVCIDGDDALLKKQFVPYIKEELLQNTSYQEVSRTIEKFPTSYNIQVNPREINLFYITDDRRERIVFEDGNYKTFDNKNSWSEASLLEHLNDHPERFSPNVLMRPLYQEVILPNLCYIGGGGELAYWLELKAYFKKNTIPYPLLLLRNSVLVVAEKQRKKLAKLQLSIENIFLSQNELLTKKTKEISDVKIDFTDQKEFLNRQFEILYTIAEKTDKSFLGAVEAQEVKQLKGLAHLEKRLLKAQKRKLKDQLERITSLQEELFPKGSLQERYNNFSELYLEYGDKLIDSLKMSLDPLSMEFAVVTL